MPWWVYVLAGYVGGNAALALVLFGTEFLDRYVLPKKKVKRKRHSQKPK